MTEAARIADQLARASDGEAWHGPSLGALLRDVDAGRAATRPIPGAHTIWELVLHLAAWRDVVRRRVAGDWADLPAEGDWPVPPHPDEAAWRAAVARLERAGRDLRDAVAALPDARLDEPIREGKGSVYLHLHGTVQHDLYHAGQIALLRRALGMGGLPG